MRTRRRMPWWTALLVLALAALLIFVREPARRVEAFGARLLAPLQFGVSGAVGEAEDLVGIVQRIRDLATLNDQFREENDRLQAEIVRLRELEVENRDLRSLLGLQQRAGSGELLPVRVIARDPSPYVQSITIDRGEEEGLRDGMPVIAWRGVVGRISRVGPTSSKVLLITDTSSSLSGRIQSSEGRVAGILRGRPEGGLIMQHIEQGETLQTGDTVVTSDLGGIMPEGLVVGQIVQVRRKDVDVFQEALIEPAADLKQLESLYIMLTQAPARGEAR